MSKACSCPLCRIGRGIHVTLINSATSSVIKDFIAEDDNALFEPVAEVLNAASEADAANIIAMVEVTDGNGKVEGAVMSAMLLGTLITYIHLRTVQMASNTPSIGRSGTLSDIIDALTGLSSVPGMQISVIGADDILQ